MAQFQYQAYDSSGAKIQGEIEGNNQKHALEQLKQQKLLVTEIKPVSSKNSGFIIGSGKVDLADLEFLTSELSLLLASGVKIDKGLNIIKRSKAKPALAKLLTDLSQRLSKGSSLSQAMAAHPQVFDALYINLVELGEASGQLSLVFQKLADDLNYRRQLQRKIITSLTYPLVILAVCVMSVVFIFNVIVPKMSVLFEGMANLPWYTSLLLSSSEWMQAYQGLLLVGLVFLAVAIKLSLANPNVIDSAQQMLLNIPGLRSAILTTERIRFNSGLAMMLEAGVPLDKGLLLAQGNLKNRFIQRQIDIVRRKVKQGQSLAPALKQTLLYPDFYVSLLEVGEESGNMPYVFEEVAKRSRIEFESWTQKMTTLIEPLLILLMGVIIGGVVVIMLMSMVSVNDVGF